MKNKEHKHIPHSIKDSVSWEISRRHFVKSLMAVGVLSQVNLLESCLSNPDISTLLTNKQLDILTSVQNILFPKDAYSPGAKDFNAQHYVLWVLADTRLDPDENKYIINGIDWVEETAQEYYDKSFLKLNKQKQVQLIQQIAQENWGESWLSVQLTLIFEAMISDPIYGFNENGVGWKWLDHQTGYPRPTKELRYASIFETVQKNIL